MQVTDTKVILEWTDVHQALARYDSPEHRIYGVPRGGMIACAFLKNAEVVTHPFYATHILDDIIDSGKTAERYKKEYPDLPFVALLNKKELGTKHQKKWVEFPWDTDHPADAHDVTTRFLQHIGEDPTRHGLIDTPKRVVKSWGELFCGYNTNPDDLLRLFEEEPDEEGPFDEVILLREIECFSTCEHHTLPFFGRAHVAYLPGDKLLGVSKLARIVEMYSRRLQIQERIGKQVTRFLMEKVGAKGAACIIEASHLCMRMRGVSKQNSVMVTSSIRGVFRQDASARSELMNLIFNNNRIG